MDLRALSPLVAVLLAGCPEPTLRYEPAQLGPAVDFVCPGDPSGVCDFSDDRELRVGAAAVSIVPERWESWTDTDGDGEFDSGLDTWDDCGGDRLCPGDPDYPGPDEGEDNGVFDAIWLAGFGNSRAMNGVADPIWARATVLQQGETAIGVVALDLVGFFFDEVVELREAAAAELGLDHVLIQSTHVHQAPDTMGQWGRDAFRSGVDADYMAQLHVAVLDALALAAQDAGPATVYAGAWDVDAAAWGGSGINNVNIDTREPHIVDERVSTVRFEVAGETVATWINFANHPEAAGGDNTQLSSDFAHTLRTTVEGGATVGPDGAKTGLGGVAIYHQGAPGGMMTPLRCDTVDLDGAVYSDDDLDKAYAVGRVVGYHALQAVEQEVVVPDPTLAVRTRALYLTVENELFWLALNAGVFDRQGYNYDEDELIGRRNVPDLLTEVGVLEVGGVSVLAVPGELLPELWLGGYDGSHTGPLQTLVDDPVRTDVGLAPAGPYLRDAAPGEHPMVFGLANDEVGYLVPPWNYKLDENSPWFNEAPGDHYEETNSVGPDATSDVVATAEGLLGWTPPAD